VSVNQDDREALRAAIDRLAGELDELHAAGANAHDAKNSLGALKLLIEAILMEQDAGRYQQ